MSRLLGIIGIVLAFVGLIGAPEHAHIFPGMIAGALQALGVAIGGVGVRNAITENAAVHGILDAGGWKTISGCLGLAAAIVLSPAVLGVMPEHVAGLVKGFFELLASLGLWHAIAKQAPTLSLTDARRT